MNFFKVAETKEGLASESASYDVLVTAIEESFEILYDETTGRTLATGAKMTLSPLGTFIGHKVTVRRKAGFEGKFDELFKFLAKPRSTGIWVSAADDQSTIEYEAYVSKGARAVSYIGKGKVYWSEMSINIVPMEAQITP